MTMGRLLIGTPGYSYKDWRGIFYPKGVAQKNWLTYYADHYNTVEINATFYRPFPKHVYESWYQRTPESFCFTLKGPRLITHEKKLHDIGDALQAFAESARGLEDKLDVMLWQFSPGTRSDSHGIKARFIDFLDLLPKDIRQVVEFRHTSWFNDEIYDLLNKHHVGFVINDSSRWPAREVVTGDFMYARFHGPGRLYASEYSEEQLKAWADRIAPRLAHHDVYAYFNNDYGGRAIRNADALKLLLID